MAPLIIGAQARKELFCRVFVDTYPNDVSAIQWPTLDEASVERLQCYRSGKKRSARNRLQ